MYWQFLEALGKKYYEGQQGQFENYGERKFQESFPVLSQKILEEHWLSHFGA